MIQSGEARSFAELLRVLDRGEFLSLLDAELADLRQSLSDHASAFGNGKSAASLSVKLHFKFDRGVISIKSEVDAALPKPPATSTLLWFGREGFAASDPQQPSLFGAKVVVANPAEAKTIYSMKGAKDD